jgi:hypothetical protein
MSNFRTTRARISTTCGFAIFDSPKTWMLKLQMRIASHGLGAGWAFAASGMTIVMHHAATASRMNQRRSRNEMHSPGSTPFVSALEQREGAEGKAGNQARLSRR